MSTRRRPDPALGVFETLLVVDGAPVEVAAHLYRLSASLAALYGAKLPAGARQALSAQARSLTLGRLRLTVRPAVGELTCEVHGEEVSPGLLFPRWDRGSELHSRTLAGGLGAHKWADRSLLALEPAGAPPLLLDSDGEVLEAGWANVFAAHNGALVTPPADGRILPGIVRARVIELARLAGIGVAEKRLTRRQLLDADEVFLTGSVRGIEPARALDGAELGAVSNLVLDISTRLRRHWGYPTAAQEGANADR